MTNWRSSNLNVDFGRCFDTGKSFVSFIEAQKNLVIAFILFVLKAKMIGFGYGKKNPYFLSLRMQLSK